MLTTIKVYVCNAVKIYPKKPKPNKYFKGVARARCAGPESAFVKLEIILPSFQYLCMIYGLRWVHVKILINDTIWDMHFQGFHKRRITNFDLI